MAKPYSRHTAPTLMQTPAGRWQLYRYPRRTSDPLQAWDAADELLHDRWVRAEQAGQQWQFPLLINDAFGALLMPVAHLQVASSSDSRVTELGQRANLADNQLASTLTQLDPLATMPATTDVVLLKLPKSQSLLQLQLAKLSAEIAPGTPILAAAKSKLFTPSVRQLFERYCDSVEVSLIERKCRVLTATIKSQPFELGAFIEQWHAAEYDLQLANYAGTFARNQLDIGARLLLENLPPSGADNVIDLGCGNGVLGILYARRSPTSKVTWVDESHLAIASCQANIASNLGANDNYQTRVDDCLSQQASESADLILCNPPFHQEHTITEHIARQMFRDARRVLRKGGEMRVVANRHLPYYHPLKRLFSHVQQIASNSKFVVYSCIN